MLAEICTVSTPNILKSLNIVGLSEVEPKGHMPPTVQLHKSMEVSPSFAHLQVQQPRSDLHPHLINYVQAWQLLVSSS